MDNETIKLAPIPKATSTHLIDKRRKSVRWSNESAIPKLSLRSRHESSFGIIMLDISNIPKVRSKQSSSNHLFDDQSPCYANPEAGNVDELLDDVFDSPQALNASIYYDARTDQNNRSKIPSKTTKIRSMSASVLMANICRRLSLDVPAYIQQQPVNEIANSKSLSVNNSLAVSNSKVLKDSGSDSDRNSRMSWKTISYEELGSRVSIGKHFAAQNITQMSWMTTTYGELGSRVSIGKHITARTRSVDSIVDVLFKVNESRTLTVENVCRNEVRNQNHSDNNNNSISDVLESASVIDDSTGSSLSVVRGSNRGEFLKETKMSSVSLLTPIPTVYKAPSPMPSECMEKMDKSIQTSIEKSRAISTTINSNEDVFQSSPCNFLKQHSTALYFNPISVTTMSSERLGFFPRVENYTTSQPSASHLVTSDLQCQKITTSEVELPSTIQFDSGCVGVSNELSIGMRNINYHWLEGTCKFVSLTRDGQIWHSNNLQVFNVPQVWHLQPKSTQCIQVRFCPPQKGFWEARLQFYFRVYKRLNKCEMKQNGDEDMKWNLSSVVTFKGMAEEPNLILSPEDKIDFGIVAEESLHVERLHIKNGGLAKFPTKISVKEVCGRDAGYYFPVESGRETLSDFFTKSVSFEKNSEIDVQIAFKAPKIESLVSGKYFDIFSAVLQIELDGIGPNPILGSIPLSATVGTAPFGIEGIERLVLRNKSPTETLNLNVIIKANSLFESVFLFWERNSSKLRTSMKLEPGQQRKIFLKFIPSSTYGARLVKPQRPSKNTYFTGERTAYVGVSYSLGNGSIALLPAWMYVEVGENEDIKNLKIEL